MAGQQFYPTKILEFLLDFSSISSTPFETVELRLLIKGWRHTTVTPRVLRTTTSLRPTSCSVMRPLTPMARRSADLVVAQYVSKVAALLR
jgi:hypothetical protein